MLGLDISCDTTACYVMRENLEYLKMLVNASVIHLCLETKTSVEGLRVSFTGRPKTFNTFLFDLFCITGFVAKAKFIVLRSSYEVVIATVSWPSLDYWSKVWKLVSGATRSVDLSSGTA